MKKTIFTLVALAGVVAAEEYSLTGDFSWGANNTPLELTGLSNQDLAITLSCDKNYKSTGYQSGKFTPDINVGKNGSWTLTLNIENSTTSTISIDSITLGAFTFTDGGSNQNSGNYRQFDFSLVDATNGNAPITLYTSIDEDQTQSSWKLDGNTINEVELDFSPLEIAGKTSRVVKLIVNDGTPNNTGDGSFIGLASISFSGDKIPEPTTATLSLLALAGLAARRRRK